MIEPFRRWMGYDGHVYMIPIQSSAIPLYYRKDLFAQAGLPAEWQPNSWQEILDAAEQIKASLPGVTPLLFIGGKEAGAQVTFNPERAVGGQANDWSIKAFQNGTGAINLYGSWAYMFHWSEGRSHPIPDLQETVGYARMPAREPGASYRGQDWVSQSGGWDYMIPASSTERADTAWELIKFLSATERQAKYNATKGQAATRWDVMQHQTFQANPFLAETSTWLEYTYMKPHFVAGFAGGPENAIREAICRIIIGEWTGREAMQHFAREMEQLMGPDKVKYQIDLATVEPKTDATTAATTVPVPGAGAGHDHGRVRGAVLLDRRARVHRLQPVGRPDARRPIRRPAQLRAANAGPRLLQQHRGHAVVRAAGRDRPRRARAAVRQPDPGPAHPLHQGDLGEHADPVADPGLVVAYMCAAC